MLWHKIQGAGSVGGDANLLLNSNPFSGTSNWTNVNSAISESGGVLAVNDNGAFGGAQQAVAVTSGNSYRLTGTMYTDGTSGQNAIMGIKHGDRANIAEGNDQAVNNTTTTPTELSFDFTATQSFVTVKCLSVSDSIPYFRGVTRVEI